MTQHNVQEATMNQKTILHTSQDFKQTLAVIMCTQFTLSLLIQITGLTKTVHDIDA